MTDTTTRHIPDRLNNRTVRIFKRWEALLLAVAIAIFVVNSFASDRFTVPGQTIIIIAPSVIAWKT